MNELKSTLALQRARRTSLRKSTISTLPRRSRKGWVGVVVVFGLALLGLMRLRSIPVSSAPALSQTVTIFPSATFEPIVSMAIPSPSLTPVTRIVCASVGWVHVRFAPGDDQPVRGYLTEGETVFLDSEQSTDMWAHLSFPISGWVDARFLCEAETP